MLTKKAFLNKCLEIDKLRTPKDYLHNHWTRLYETYKQCCRIISGRSGAKILSVGSGRAYVECVLARHHDANVTVIDFEEEIARNKKVYSTYNFDCISGDFLSDDLSLSARRFDIVLLCEIIEHIPLAPRYQFEKVIPYLADDGVVLVTTPNFGSLRNAARLLLDKPVVAAPEKLFSAAGHANQSVHRREYLFSELRNQFALCSLVVTTSRGIWPRPPMSRNEKLLRGFEALLPRLRPYMLMVGRREVRQRPPP